MISTLHEKRFVIVVFFLILAALLGIVPSLAQTGGSNNIYLPTVSNQFDPAWLWQDAQRLKLSPSPDSYDPMPLAIDSAGQPVLIYDSYYTPRYIYYTYPSAQGWITPTQIADTLGTSYTLYPPARDEQGKLHLLWSNSLGTGVSDPYRLMYASLDKGVWSAEEEIYRFSSDTQGMVRPDASGKLHVTSAETIVFSGIRHFVRTTSGWSAPISVPSPSATRWIWPD